MTIFELAKFSIEACEKEGVAYMLTGAFATNCYSVPRSTKDVDLVIDLSGSLQVKAVIERLSPEVEFRDQVQFDTATFGRRHVGRTKVSPYFTVELFELFDDEFVMSQFSRKRQFDLGPELGMNAYVPTAEDILVQKLRWARDKDLLDARNLLLVQQVKNLDMSYVRKWCEKLGIKDRLEEVLKVIED